MKYVKRTQCQNVQELFLNNLGVSSLDEVTTWFRRYKEDSYDIKGIDNSEIDGEVEIDDQEQNDIITNEISEIEAQTPLTTHLPAPSQTVRS